MDKNLNDDMLKLVRYKVLFIKRDYEFAFPEQEDLVHDNLDGNSFTAWKIAEFIQDLARVKSEKSAEDKARVGIRVPKAWKTYPTAGKYTDNGYLTGIPDQDKKYLRIFYEVLERFPRERFMHGEREIEVLGEIRDRMPPPVSASRCGFRQREGLLRASRLNSENLKLGCERLVDIDPSTLGSFVSVSKKRSRSPSRPGRSL